jgi:hypothetical protein
MAGTKFARATCRTIRLKRLEIGAPVKLSVRRIMVAMTSSRPDQEDFAKTHRSLCRAAR